MTIRTAFAEKFGEDQATAVVAAAEGHRNGIHDDLKAWIKAEADLGSHDGDIDYMAAFGGAYDEYLPERA